MRKVLLALVIMSLIFTSGCVISNEPAELKESKVGEINTSSPIVLEIVNNTVKPEGLTLRIVNDSEQSIGYNGAFTLEQNIDEEWYVVNDIVGGKFEFADEGLGTEANSSTEIPIDWRGIYGELNPGYYRILFNVGDEQERYYLAAEFLISD